MIEDSGLPDKNVCPYCGGDLIPSKKSLMYSIHMYWQKPWGNPLKMDEPVVPSACMNCGRVVLYLRDSSRVLAEYSQHSPEEKETIKDQ